MRWISFFLVLGAAAAAQPATVQTEPPIRRAFNRLYNFDFAGAHEILDRQIAQDPSDPLPQAVKAAAYLFAELNRLKIMELDFFSDDEKLVDRKKLVPDPAIRASLFKLVDNVQRLGNARLAARPDDRDAMLSMCMVTGLVADYAALVEKRRFGSFPLHKKSQAWAAKLLALKPPVYDAYLTFGTAEYVVGSLPFFVRWFVHLDQVEGSKQKGIQELQLVADKGQYYGPFARILLAVAAFREKRPADAGKLLAALSAEYPDNPLFRQERDRAARLARADQRK